jgi:hypothetical protein
MKDDPLCVVGVGLAIVGVIFGLTAAIMLTGHLLIRQSDCEEARSHYDRVTSAIAIRWMLNIPIAPEERAAWDQAAVDQLYACGGESTP